jgi:hypothetical protein
MCLLMLIILPINIVDMFIVSSLSHMSIQRTNHMDLYDEYYLPVTNQSSNKEVQAMLSHVQYGHAWMLTAVKIPIVQGLALMLSSFPILRATQDNRQHCWLVGVHFFTQSWFVFVADSFCRIIRLGALLSHEWSETISPSKDLLHHLNMSF